MIAPVTENPLLNIGLPQELPKRPVERSLHPKILLAPFFIIDYSMVTLEF